MKIHQLYGFLCSWRSKIGFTKPLGEVGLIGVLTGALIRPFPALEQRWSVDPAAWDITVRQLDSFSAKCWGKKKLGQKESLFFRMNTVNSFWFARYLDQIIRSGGSKTSDGVFHPADCVFHIWHKKTRFFLSHILQPSIIILIPATIFLESQYLKCIFSSNV